MLRNCLILNYSIIHNTPVITLNVKIPKHHFHMGLTAPDSHQVKFMHESQNCKVQSVRESPTTFLSLAAQILITRIPT